MEDKTIIRKLLTEAYESQKRIESTPKYMRDDTWVFTYIANRKYIDDLRVRFHETKPQILFQGNIRRNNNG